jgi:hypothetical protein
MLKRVCHQYRTIFDSSSMRISRRIGHESRSIFYPVVSKRIRSEPQGNLIDSLTKKTTWGIVIEYKPINAVGPTHTGNIVGFWVLQDGDIYENNGYHGYCSDCWNGCLDCAMFWVRK